jgi:tetratricopeptide (TPR) repeat protein
MRGRARRYLALAERELAAGRHDDARHFAAKAVRTARDDDTRAEALLVAGTAAEELSDFAGAADLLEAAAATAERASAGVLCRSLLALGNVRRIEARYPQALAILERALATAPDDAHRVAGLNALGVVHRYAGRFDEASALYARALTLCEATVGAGHPDTAGMLHNLAGLAHARGAFAQAEPLARRAVEIRERRWGPDHPTVAADVAVLGAILTGLGRLDEAESAIRRALGVFEARFGGDHYEVGVNRSNLAAIVVARGEVEQARSLFASARAIKVRALGPRHPEVDAIDRAVASLRRGPEDDRG